MCTTGSSCSSYHLLLSKSEAAALAADEREAAGFIVDGDVNDLNVPSSSSSSSSSIDNWDVTDCINPDDIFPHNKHPFRQISCSSSSSDDSPIQQQQQQQQKQINVDNRSKIKTEMMPEKRSPDLVAKSTTKSSRSAKIRKPTVLVKVKRRAIPDECLEPFQQEENPKPFLIDMEQRVKQLQLELQMREEKKKAVPNKKSSVTTSNATNRQPLMTTATPNRKLATTAITPPTPATQKSQLPISEATPSIQKNKPIIVKEAKNIKTPLVTSTVDDSSESDCDSDDDDDDDSNESESSCSSSMTTSSSSCSNTSSNSKESTTKTAQKKRGKPFVKKPPSPDLLPIRRAVHKLCEYKRRIGIKKHIETLRTLIPALGDNKKVKSITILKAAVEHLNEVTNNNKQLVNTYENEKARNKQLLSYLEHLKSLPSPISSE